MRARSINFSGDILSLEGRDTLGPLVSPGPPRPPGDAGRKRGEDGLAGRPPGELEEGVNEVKAKLRRLESPLLDVELIEALLP